MHLRDLRTARGALVFLDTPPGRELFAGWIAEQFRKAFTSTSNGGIVHLRQMGAGQTRKMHDDQMGPKTKV